MTQATRFFCQTIAFAAALTASTGLAWAEGDQQAVAAVEPLEEVSPLSPMASAIAQSFSDAREGDAVAAFYAARGFEPLWMLPDGTPNRRSAALIDALNGAATHALPVERYSVAELAASLAAKSTVQETAALDRRLTESFLRYARDVSSGVLEPRKADREILVKPLRPEIGNLLAEVSESDDVAAMLASLAPQAPGYSVLLGRLEEYQRLAKSDAWSDGLRKGPTLRPGDRSERVVELRRRLIAMGDLDPAAPVETTEPEAGADTVVAANDIVTDLPPQGSSDPAVFDATVQAAVESFQARHGLNQDGVVGPATREALNTSPTKRARQIAVNLERMRWLNRDLGKRHVKVNLAGFDMALVEDGEAIFTSRVVVGKARRHRTPEFSDEMEYMVINPTWHVPNSIATEEILPKLQEDPDYLARKNMRLVGSDSEVIDWSFVTPSSFPGRIKQGPGPGNALGKVKFMFPNDHAIYLHDTPSKSLFRRDRRAYSHGCVRVQKPFEFAYHLLGPQEEDAQAYFDRIVRRGAERYVNLDEHVPVHLTYRTAWVDENGVDQFRSDIYGRDKRVFAALEKAGVSLLPD